MLDIPNKVKQLLKADGILKNIRISFPNGERSDICNDTLIKESVKFDESISSREEIKFGLCESSRLSFECVDLENIKGMEIDAAVEIDSTSLIENDMSKRRAQKPLIILATPEGEDEEKIFVVVDVPELQADGAEYTAQDGSDLYWIRQDMADVAFVRNMNSAHRMTLSYYRNMTGVDPRGDYEDMYDGYHGGGYKRTYIYSVASQKFYPAHREAVSTHVPVSMRIDRGFKSNAFLDALNHVYFDSEKGQYVCPLGKYEYPIEAHKPIITRIIDNENEYFVIVTNISEDNPTSTEVATDDGTEMMGCTFGSDDARYFTFDCTNITSAHAAGSIDFDYYRSATGHDPRGSVADNYDGYRGGGYAMTYVYSTATHKFYPCETADWEGSWNDDMGYDIPFETMPLSYVFADGITSDEWFKRIGGVLFDDEQRIYYAGEDVDGIQTADDVPFPFYRIPLGRFVVDECKRDASMKRRKVVAYSTYSEFSMPRYIEEASRTQATMDLNVFNFILVSAQNTFVDYEKLTFTPLTPTFSHGESSEQVINVTWTAEDPDSEVWDCNVILNITYKKSDSIGAHDAPDMAMLLRCNDNGITDADRDTIEGYLTEFVEFIAASTVLSASIPESIEPTITRAVENAIRPIPYTYFGQLPHDYLMGVQIGDIYATGDEIFFISGIEIKVGIVPHGWTMDYAFERTYTNARTESVLDYEAVDTSFYPQILMRMESDSRQYIYRYLFSFLDLDIRELLESYCALMGCFGRMGRDGYFHLLSLAEIEIEGLFPNHDIYPNSTIFPTPYEPITSDTSGVAIIEDDCVTDLWYEEYFVAFGRLTCEYMSSEVLDEDNNPMPVMLEIVWNNDERYLTYDATNVIISHGIYTVAEIKALLEPLIQAVKKIKFYPSDLSCVGLPYIEAGDWYLASSHGNKILGLILSRSMSGIQALRDKMKSD